MSKVEITQIEEDRYAQLQLMALDYAREGETNNLEVMIKHGMSVNLSTHKDDTLLMLAAYNGHLDMARMLIRKGGNLDQKNERGQTPLEGVCFKGNLVMVKLLVENGATIYKNAIIYASIFGHKKIVKYLKDQGVDKNRLTFFGLSTVTIVAISSQIKKLFKLKESK